MAVPPAAAEAAVIGPTSELIRRIEIYEADGTTRWAAGANDDRLIGGTVTIDYSRDERRSVDLELDNSDFALEHAPDAFWYDKILKVFCGVRYVDTSDVISHVIRTNLSTNPRVGTNSTGWAALGSGTFSSARITGAGNAYSDTALETTWSVASADTGGGSYYLTPVGAAVFTAGELYSFGIDARVSKSQRMNIVVQFWNDSAMIAGQQFAGDEKVVTANEWNSFTLNGLTCPVGTTRVMVGAFSVSGTGSSIWNAGDKTAATMAVIIKEPVLKNRFSGATQDFANRDYRWTGTAELSQSEEDITISTPSAVDAVWETQVGEFMIDSISEDHFPYTVKVNGRDYTKKCLQSKFVVATALANGTAIETAIKSLAQNAGCTKFIMPVTGKALGKDYFFERGVSRWEAMKQIADAFGYEIFFDAQGYLVMREYLDPVTAPLAYSLATGEIIGNLTAYNKTVNDTRIYNHIVVTGETNDDTLPVYATAENHEPSSPTRIEEIGDRVYQYTSSFITTVAQAQDVADKFLQIHALEEFDLNFSSISLFWLEVGEIVEFIDPRSNTGQPDRLLLSSINLPLDLGPMSGNAKRVSVVG